VSDYSLTYRELPTEHPSNGDFYAPEEEMGCIDSSRKPGIEPLMEWNNVAAAGVS
jgi:hypothetical protein